MSNEEIIIQELKRLNDTTWQLYEMSKLQISSTKDLLQEISDILQMILQNQNQAYLIAGIKPESQDSICGRIGCNHHIDYHKLFSGCQVSECECEQFYRKEK